VTTTFIFSYEYVTLLRRLILTAVYLETDSSDQDNSWVYKIIVEYLANGVTEHWTGVPELRRWKEAGLFTVPTALISKNIGLQYSPANTTTDTFCEEGRFCCLIDLKTDSSL
jgi:hypothetical protein